MTVEILYFDGCPNYRPLLARMPPLLHRAGIDAAVASCSVPSEEAAQELRFLGSPTVRVDGRDVEPGAEERSDYGLKCRLYRTAEGISGQPPDTWIIAAARDRMREAAGP
ncbi:MAG: DF family (seleno)protein [Solirubrobacteraceae bacterium]